jgi:hypothetical protein
MLPGWIRKSHGIDADRLVCIRPALDNPFPCFIPGDLVPFPIYIYDVKSPNHQKVGCCRLSELGKLFNPQMFQHIHEFVHKHHYNAKVHSSAELKMEKCIFLYIVYLHSLLMDVFNFRIVIFPPTKYCMTCCFGCVFMLMTGGLCCHWQHANLFVLNFLHLVPKF